MKLPWYERWQTFLALGLLMTAGSVFVFWDLAEWEADPNPLVEAIRENPDDGPRWLALAAWYADQGRADEADAVRILWPTFRDNLSGRPLGHVLASLAESAPVFGSIARQIEGRNGSEDPAP